MKSTTTHKNVEHLVKTFQSTQIDKIKDHELAASLAIEDFPVQYQQITGNNWDNTLKPKVIEKLAKSSYDIHWITKPPPLECKYMHLFILCKNADAKIISEYIRKNGKVAANSCDSIKRTPLHVAASYGNYGAVDILIKHCKVDPIDKYLRTPLQMACLSGSLECVKLLVEKGKANFRHKDAVYT
jgi:ankyrin repeat protein